MDACADALIDVVCRCCHLAAALCHAAELPWTCTQCQEIEAAITVQELIRQLELLPRDAKVMMAYPGALVRFRRLPPLAVYATSCATP